MSKQKGTANRVPEPVIPESAQGEVPEIVVPPTTPAPEVATPEAVAPEVTPEVKPIPASTIKVSAQPVPLPKSDGSGLKSKAKSGNPEVAGTGRFQAVAVGAKYVVFNPAGQMVSGEVSFEVASDMVRNQNRAAQL